MDANLKKLALLGLSSLLLTGCSANMDELDRYINEVKARDGGRIDPQGDPPHTAKFATNGFWQEVKFRRRALSARHEAGAFP